MGKKSTSTRQEEEMAEKMRSGTWEEVYLDEKGEAVEKEEEGEEQGEAVEKDEEVEEKGEAVEKEEEVEENGEDVEDIDVTATKCEHPWVEYRNGSWSVKHLAQIKSTFQFQVLLLLQPRAFLCCLWGKSCN